MLLTTLNVEAARFALCRLQWYICASAIVASDEKALSLYGVSLADEKNADIT